MQEAFWCFNVNQRGFQASSI
uniref:Uncharacterized protein n=1 Tax=Moniliophthora roreri TaxID=221103 RepID=A0A0W0F8F2_MONRR